MNALKGISTQSFFSRELPVGARQQKMMLKYLPERLF